MEFEIFATELEDAPPRFYGCRRDDVVVGPFGSREEAEDELVKACSDPGSPLVEAVASLVATKPVRWGDRAVGGTTSFGVWEFFDQDGNPFYVVIGLGGMAHRPVYSDQVDAESLSGQLQAEENKSALKP